MTEPRAQLYILSAAVGVVGGGFGMLMFMFSLIEAQATYSQRVNSHLEEWHEFRDTHNKQEAECEKERKEILKMVYDIREKLLTINGKRNLP